MHQRGHVNNIDQLIELTLMAHAKEVIKQFGLRGFDFFRHFDGGDHIGHRIMRVTVFNAIRYRKVLQFKAGKAFFIFRPFHPFRS